MTLGASTDRRREQINIINTKKSTAFLCFECESNPLIYIIEKDVYYCTNCKAVYDEKIIIKQHADYEKKYKTRLVAANDQRLNIPIYFPVSDRQSRIKPSDDYVERWPELPSYFKIREQKADYRDPRSLVRGPILIGQNDAF